MAKMTVSQCLRSIATLKGKLKLHKDHAWGAVLYDEKHKPAYDFITEMENIERAKLDLLHLQTALAISNATTYIEWQGQKMVVAKATRILEEDKGHKAWLESLIVAADAKKTEDCYVQRYSDGQAVSVNEPRTMICELPEAMRFERMQRLQEEFDQLNDIVETSNHQTLVEV
jgi:hypothetical protein